MSQWDGPEGQHWAEQADRYSRVLEGFTEPILSAAALAAGEHVLDVGCGCGDLALAAARSLGPTSRVVGVDLAPAMVEVARRRATEQGLGSVEFAVSDVTTFAGGRRRPSAGFDVAVSRFGVMYFADPAAAFTNIASLLRPGGRFVFTCWRELLANDWMTVPGLALAEVAQLPRSTGSDEPSPFGYADPEVLRSVLGSAGFSPPQLTPVDRTMWLGSDAADVVSFLRTTGFGRAVLDTVGPDATEAAFHHVEDVLRRHESPAGVMLKGAAWLVRAEV